LRGEQRGFSLLELLVALFVIVLVTSLVSLNLGSGGRDIELEARVRNLADVAAYALDEAQLTGRDYGLLLGQEVVEGETLYRYAWRERYVDGWRPPASGKDVFAEQVLPAGFELQLELEDSVFRERELAGAEDGVRDEDEEERPQVVLYASGETTVGLIDVRRRDNGELLWRVQWDLLGRFSVLPRGEELEDSPGESLEE
jgi:prepilin-type N-terminal cleavage/methylation domain-containing protein